MKIMGRPSKSISELKSTGSYRKDRHGNREDVSVPALVKGTTINPPASIVNGEIQTYWKSLTSELIDNQLITQNDLPILEQAFIFLQNTKALNIEIEKMEAKGILENLKDYSLMISTKKKMIDSYYGIMTDFFLTPKGRTKMVKNKTDNNQKSEMALLLEDLV